MLLTSRTTKYKADHFFKMFADSKQSFGGLKARIGKNNSSGITDSCPGCGRPQTAHTVVQIIKVKDLTLISVFNPSGLLLEIS